MGLYLTQKALFLGEGANLWSCLNVTLCYRE